MAPIIVGIGASAGGQDAFARFFQHVPATNGLAFVLIQHLDPVHQTFLPETIATSTTMPVCQAEEAMELQPDHVYTIPRGSDLVLRQGRLHLFDRPVSRSLHLPIDTFFRSLAGERKEEAIAVVLSGAGSDGTLGIGAVKEEGGIVLVQEPATAAFDGMPRSAIATGLADLILPPEAMPERILAYARQAHAHGQAQEESSPPPIEAQSQATVPRILGLLAVQTGHDFSDYKPTTVRRRIERRMALNQIGNAESYYRYLQDNQAEGQMLFEDLLIGVTQFFRDPEAFAALQKLAIPQILHLAEGRQSAEPVRVWVPGCATGEEAYSIGMLIQETMDAAGAVVPVTIFASDLDGRAIDKARRAAYPPSVGADIGPERLARFFVEADGKYQVAEHIRRMVVFAAHDVIHDPPFSRLRPDQLSQPADLPGRGLAKAGDVHLPLCAQTGRPAVPGKFRIARDIPPVVRAAGPQAPALPARRVW